MFFLIPLLIGVIGVVVLSFFQPKQKLSNATPGKLADVNFPRASEGAPIPRIYGTVKFKAPNTIWDGDFASVAITKRVATGLFSHKNQIIGYKYYIGLDLAICLGPCFIFKRIWAGNYELWNGCITECENVINVNYPNLFGGNDKNGGWVGTIALYCGGYDQDQDPYLQLKIFPSGDNQVPAYNGVAHMVLRHCYMGNSPSIQPLYVEGACYPDSLGLGALGILYAPNKLDMNAVGILHHIFTDDWGNLGIDITKIKEDQWREVAQRIYDENIGSSLQVSSAAQASDAIKELLSQINATIYQNPATGLYELVLIRDDYDIANLPVLGPSNISAVQNFTKILWSETFNTVRVKYIDRSQGYKEDVVALAQDFAQIRFQKKVKPQEIPMQSIYDTDVANRVAARELSNINVPLYGCTLVLDRMGSALPPASVFVFNWPEYNVVNMVMRVKKLGLGTLADGSITMDVLQDVFASNAVVMAPPVTSPYIKPDQSPQAIVTSVIYELPYWLDYNAQLGTLDKQQSMGVFALKPGQYSQAFNAYIVGIPEDAEVLSTAPYSFVAKLAASLDRWNGFVVGVIPTLIVSDVSSADAMVAGDFRAGNGLFSLNGEIMAFDTAANNGDGTWTLTNVYRALLDTEYEAGLAGDVLFFFNGQEGFVDGGFAQGAVLDFKLADLTATGEFADPAVQEVTVAGRLGLPIPPDGLTVAGTRASDTKAVAGAVLTVAWPATRNRLADRTRIVIESDGPQAPEAGTAYRLQVTSLDGATVLFTADDIAATTYDLTIDATMTGEVLIAVSAKVGTLLSYKPAVYPLHVLGELTVDANRVTIDGNGILF